jgi:pimeloyl-ACP methyl ester carboxylesterase
MKLRSIAGAAVGAVGLTAVANRVLAGRAGDLESPLDGESGTYRWRGFDIAYTEAGDPDDPDLLCLHGVNASGSSHEFRHVFGDLAEDYHVVAPDLPGFGRSDRPPLLYSGPLYATFVEDFARDMTEDATVLASSLAGAYATAAAESVEFTELVLVCPTATTFPGRRAWLRTAFRAPLFGEALYNLTTSKPSIRYFNADHGYYDEDNVTDDLVDYQWQTSHQPGARYAPASFIGGFLDLDIDLGSALSNLDEPVTLVWGREASITPLEGGQKLAEAADARLVVFDESDVQPHVEHPGQFVRQVLRDALDPDAAEIEIEEPGESTEPEE